VGILYTHNDLLLRAIENIGIFSAVSHPIQMILSKLLTDDNFIDGFLKISRKKLGYSYDIATQKLRDMNIPFVAVSAGIFVYCDFSSYLPEASSEGESKLAGLIQDVARIVMTPGQSQRDHRPGMFRICYAWVSPEVLITAMTRLEYVLNKLKEYGWEGVPQHLASFDQIFEAINDVAQ